MRIMIQYRNKGAWTPIQGKQLPVVWEKETHRAYETREITLDPAQAEEMLRQALMEALEEQMEEGKVLQADYEVTRQGDLLQVKLVAQCTEQIGRMVEMDTQEKAVGAPAPREGNHRGRRENQGSGTRGGVIAHDGTDSQH